MQNAVNAVDPETGGGELTIRIPKEVLACANGNSNIKHINTYGLIAINNKRSVCKEKQVCQSGASGFS